MFASNRSIQLRTILWLLLVYWLHYLYAQLNFIVVLTKNILCSIRQHQKIVWQNLGNKILLFYRTPQSIASSDIGSLVIEQFGCILTLSSILHSISCFTRYYSRNTIATGSRKNEIQANLTTTFSAACLEWRSALISNISNISWFQLRRHNFPQVQKRKDSRAVTSFL